ncbi:MAG: extracellular solute-binding protein [Dehalococcoidales bacterium]|nr:extracellular solute-binding protein [Dehalococcoidales bacterium]
MVSRRTFLHRTIKTGLAVGTGLLLSGCAQGAQTPTPTSSAPASVPPTAGAAKPAAPSGVPGAEVLRPGQPYKGTTINYISLNYTYSQGLKTIIQGFQEATGMTVNMELLGTLDNFQKQRLELSVGSSKYDVYQVPPFNRAEYQKADWLAPLGALVGDENLTPKAWDMGDFFPVSLEQGMYEGKRLDLPIFSATIIFYYRKDVFESAGIQGPPATFDELLTVCDKLKKQGTDVSPIGLRGAPGIEANMWPFPILLYSYGGNFFKDFPKDMRPALTEPGSIKSVEVWTKLVTEYGFPAMVNATHEELIVAMQQGKVAMVLDGHPLAGVFLDKEKSKAYGKTGVAPIPSGPAGRFPAFSEHGIAIAKNAKNKEAAWEFVKWATSRDVLVEVALQTPYVAATRRSAIENPKYQEKYNYADGEFLKVTKQMLEERKPTYVPPIPEWAEVGDVIGNAVSKATLGQVSAADAMKQAEAEVDRILKQAKYY